jgi:hypothetical protein
MPASSGAENDGVDRRGFLGRLAALPALFRCSANQPNIASVSYGFTKPAMLRSVSSIPRHWFRIKKPRPSKQEKSMFSIALYFDPSGIFND